MDENQTSQIQLNVQWTINPNSVPVPSNNLLIVDGIGVGAGSSTSFELHFGHVSPPPIFAETPEEFSALAAANPALVNSVGHMLVSVDALRQMYETIGEALRKHNEG